MNSYKGIFVMNFKMQLQYRAQAISGIMTQLFWGIMYICLYTAFMQQRAISGFSSRQMTSYIWLGQAFFALRYVLLPQGCAKEITSGDVCYKFVKPIDLYNQWFAQSLGEKLSMTMLRCGPIIVLSLALNSYYGLMPPVSFVAFLLFLLALILSCLMAVALSMLGIYLTFATLSPKGTINILNVITGLLSGVYIPLPLMPQTVQNVLSFLPFRVIGDLPFRIYIGNYSITQSLIYIAIALVWLTAIIAIGKLLLFKLGQKATIQGG